MLFARSWLSQSPMCLTVRRKTQRPCLWTSSKSITWPMDAKISSSLCSFVVIWTQGCKLRSLQLSWSIVASRFGAFAPKEKIRTHLVWQRCTKHLKNWWDSLCISWWTLSATRIGPVSPTTSHCYWISLKVENTRPCTCFRITTLSWTFATLCFRKSPPEQRLRKKRGSRWEDLFRRRRSDLWLRWCPTWSDLCTPSRWWKSPMEESTYRLTLSSPMRKTPNYLSCLYRPMFRSLKKLSPTWSILTSSRS